MWRNPDAALLADDAIAMLGGREAFEDKPAWPKPEPLGDGLPEVAKFDPDLLPESLRPLVEDVAERMQVPLDFPAIVAIACLSGAVGRRAIVQPKRVDSGWTITPNLWAAIVAPPGAMKSPCIDAITTPLKRVEADWRKRYEEALKRHAVAVEEGELRLSAWKESYKVSCKSGKPAPARPEFTIEEPKCKRLLVHDATFESLHRIMADNPGGVMVIRDELSGWMAQLDREGREGERAFCLQAWNGNSPFTLDRIGRGSIHVDACCMSMLGGIQPGRLRSYLADALADGPSNDGLMQRFQLLVWPDLGGEWRYVDRKPDNVAEEQAARIYKRLAEMDPEAQPRYRFDDAAQELFIEWLAELENRLRHEPMHPALAAHLSKYRKLMPSLGLLFELADRAAGGFEGFDGSSQGQIQNIRLPHAARAAGVCKYLETHAARVYSCVTSSHYRSALDLLTKIKERRIAGNGLFTLREVYLRGWAGLDSPEKARLACEVLADAGWIREVPAPISSNGGRPSQRYEVNPEATR
jgi:putative DNA primase/helicase